MRARTAATVALAALLTACGGSQGAAEDPTTSDTSTSSAVETPDAEPASVSGSVTMWIPPIAGDEEAPYWEERIAAFNQEYPDVDVQVEVVPWENRDERITTAIAGGNVPDIYYVLPRDVPKFAELDVIADLGHVIDPTRDDFYESGLEALSWEGTNYGVPTLMTVTTTIYSKPVFDELGITEYPATWDEVREMAPTIADAGYFVTQYEGAPTMTLNGSFYPLLWQAGGEILNEDQTAAVFNGPEGLEALEFVKFLVDNGYTPKDALTTALPVETSPLGQGKVAMVFSRSIASLQQNGIEPEDMVVAEPLRNKESVSYGSAGGFVRFNDAASPEAADAWLSWITSSEELAQFLPPRGVLSPRPSMEGLYADDPVLAAQEAVLGNMTTGLNHPKESEIMDLIKPHLQQALLGQADPQAALDAAAAEVDAALTR